MTVVTPVSGAGLRTVPHLGMHLILFSGAEEPLFLCNINTVYQNPAMVCFYAAADNIQYGGLSGTIAPNH